MTWILLPSGSEVDLLDPDPSTFQLRDLLRGVCFINRFSGAVGDYSVGDHLRGCVAYAQQRGWDIAAQAACFAHDLHEAYFGDISSPVKQAIGSAAVRQAEDVVQTAVASWLTPIALAPYAAQVREADMALLQAERNELLRVRTSPWLCDHEVIVPHTQPLYIATRPFLLADLMRELQYNGFPWSTAVREQLR